MKFVRFAALPIVLTSFFMTGCASRTYYAAAPPPPPYNSYQSAPPLIERAEHEGAFASAQKPASATSTMASAITRSAIATSTTLQATIQQWVPTARIATPSADPTSAVTTSPTIVASVPARYQSLIHSREWNCFGCRATKEEAITM